MLADVPLKSKRVVISLAVLSTPFLTLDNSASQTVSNEGIFVGSVVGAQTPSDVGRA
jgi:hypothetical protein